MNSGNEGQFRIAANPITCKMMLEALQFVESITESAHYAETFAAFEKLQLRNEHLRGLKERIQASGKKTFLNLTLGDHMLLYTCYFLFTKFYTEELTNHMLASMDDMDTMHIDKPEVIQLRFYREEMLQFMDESLRRFASFPLFTKHVETLELTFPLLLN